MKILVLGGTGAMGNFLVRLLNQNKHDVYVTSRKKRQNFGNINYLEGDALNIKFLTEILSNKWDAIVDFMSYGTNIFRTRMELLLKSTNHYIFLSSARVYADSKSPLVEESARLLNVTTDENYLKTDEYALAKARQENCLRNSDFLNWTIIRPYITYAEERLQLGVLEKENWLYRVMNDRTVVFPQEMMKKTTTLTYGEDVAFSICNIINNPETFGKIYHITNNNPILWEDVFSIYSNTIYKLTNNKPKIKLINNEDFILAYDNKYQIIYDRLYDRVFDNSSINKIVDTSKFISVEEGLYKCLISFYTNANFRPINWAFYANMDKITGEVTPLENIDNIKDRNLYKKYRNCPLGKGKYTDEQNVQVLIALLKKHNIKKVIVSPGTTNISFVGSIQYDPDFEIYSCVDERSAAYMACGMAEESGETVCLSCTGATASRNYFPALTEAFYRKLPILAITSTQFISKVGHNVAQVIDRSNLPKDAVRHSVTLPVVKDRTDFWDCVDKVNIALLELNRNGGGPVHINLQTGYSKNFNVSELPEVRVIRRINHLDNFPALQPRSRVAIFVGSHKKMNKDLVDAIDRFCEVNDAVVFCDHTSGYNGKYKVQYALVACQRKNIIEKPDILIYIGEITGDYYSLSIGANEQVWRVSKDGEVRDPIGRLTYVFDMAEQDFFEHYSNIVRSEEKKNEYFKCCRKQLELLHNNIPDVPFSNIWVASKLSSNIPENSVIHFGILNSLRSWNFFELPSNVESNANVGGFGIDGCVSTLIGASLVNPNKLYFLVIGDLAFFYDMNVLGNRHLKNNVRILLINNGKGTEFRNYGHYAQIFGEDTDNYIAGARHFGNKSDSLVKHYAEDLGFSYLSATNKEEFMKYSEIFTNPEIGDKSILFEVFTNSEDESKALESMLNLLK